MSKWNQATATAIGRTTAATATSPIKNFALSGELTTKATTTGMAQ